MEVAPFAASSVGTDQFLYVIRESHALPRVDCFRALKHVLLSELHVESCSRWLSKHKVRLALSFVVGIANASAVPFLPASAGRIVVFIGLTQLPNLFASIISLRFDMVRLILTTYEFRYSSCLNVMFSIAIVVNYQDERALSLVPTLFSLELLALQDANFRALRFAIGIFCFVAVLQVMFILFVNLHLIDKWHSAQILRYGTHAVTTDNIMSNYLIFTTTLLLRNAYRKHRWVRDCNGGETTVVRCISYRCGVRLCLLQQPQPQIRRRPSDKNERMTQLRLVPSDQVYDANQTVAQSLFRASRARRLFTSSCWSRSGLQAIGISGLMLSIFAVIHESDHSKPNSGLSKLDIVSILSALSSGFFCGAVGCFYQRQLLYKLLLSFDFMFLSSNITIMHICICDASLWTDKCLAILSIWIWIMWAITMDALPPDLRQALGLRRFHLMITIAIFVLLLMLLTVDLIFIHKLDLQDRTLFHVKAHGTTIDVHVFQFFFSSLISVFPMCVRLLWRLHSAQSSEFILIQGAVEYDDVVLAQRRKRQQARVKVPNYPGRSREMPRTIHPTPTQTESSAVNLILNQAKKGSALSPST